jgi:hypothetical protein
VSGDAYRRLAEALDEIALWSVLAPLLPFAVHHDHLGERIAARIPRQRAREITLPRRTEVPRQ